MLIESKELCLMPLMVIAYFSELYQKQNFSLHAVLTYTLRRGSPFPQAACYLMSPSYPETVFTSIT